MIASLRGEIRATTTSGCVVDVGGVGFAVALTPAHARALQMGVECEFLTRLIVREDAMQLFGFESEGHLGIFDALLTVSGIGPRSALAVLSELTPGQIYSAVADEDDAPFRKVSGIGPKTAKLVVVSLAGRLTHLLAGDRPEEASALGDAVPPPSAVAAQVVAALIGLGWNEKVASDAVQRSVTDAPMLDAASLLRASLSQLGTPGSPS